MVFLFIVILHKWYNSHLPHGGGKWGSVAVLGGVDRTSSPVTSPFMCKYFSQKYVLGIIIHRKYSDLTFTLSRNVNLTEKWTYQPKHFLQMDNTGNRYFGIGLGFSLRFNRPYNTCVSYSFSSSADHRAMHRGDSSKKSTSGRAGILLAYILGYK